MHHKKNRRRVCSTPPGSVSSRLICQKCRIDCIKILGIQIILYNPKTLTESLEMHDFTLTKVTNRVTDIMVVYQAEDIVIGSTCLLLCCHIFRQVRNRVSLRLEERRPPIVTRAQGYGPRNTYQSSMSQFPPASNFW